MRKFIVSDLHGNGEVYNSIIGYLENISLCEDVELYINGDLIDRGIDSFTMLMDVYERINGKGNIKINYLGGNHELMMWQALKERKPGKAVRRWCNWMCNGGWVVEGELDSREESLTNELFAFLGKLKIYHKFEEKVRDDNVLLVHAQAPKNIKEECHLKISDDNEIIEKAVWTRKFDEFNRVTNLGKKGFLTITGHTPIVNGFAYYGDDNSFNIDGGCAAYANGAFEYDKVPLVEVKNNILEIVIFNHNNEIVNGYIYDGELYEMDNKYLNKKREFINHEYDGCMEKQKTLIKEILEIR
ncbi:MAG: hypothetical protein IJ097_01675 [Bacilli bacterium]|nr:hypothetical protein [Bacilli bacterium]